MIPDQFVMPASYAPTDQPNIMKPTYGSVGTQHVKFFMHKEYSGSDSLAAGKEVSRELEMCAIKNDPFCTATFRVNDLSVEHKIAFAKLYEQFKTQTASDETQILDWEAISDQQKEHLFMAGVRTVEQLNSYQDHELHRLGPAGTDLRNHARRHMATKNEMRPVDHSAELSLLRQEKEEMAERLKRLEAQYFEREEKEAAKARKKGDDHAAA